MVMDVVMVVVKVVMMMGLHSKWVGCLMLVAVVGLCDGGEGCVWCW